MSDASISRSDPAFPPSTSSPSASSTKNRTRTTSPSQHQKPCSRCQKPRDVLVRCQTTVDGDWQFVCPGKCWKEVSGGVIDGDGKEGHEGYRYGGMWKNKWAGVSAKKKRKPRSNEKIEHESPAMEPQDPESVIEQSVSSGVKDWQGDTGDSEEHQHRYTRNDQVSWKGKIWICRRSHMGEGSKQEREPGVGYRFWKEAQ